MGFLIAFMFLFFLTYSLPFYASKLVMSMTIVIVIDIFIIGVLFVLIKNTYSQRILK